MLHRLALEAMPDLVRNVEENELIRQLPKEVRQQIAPIVHHFMVNVGVGLAIDEVGPYLDNLQESLERIQKLNAAAAAMKNDTGQDILRASVVFLHASLEDFLRTMATKLLPEAGEETLNDIPLAGLGGRPKNFALGKLVQHKGKTVDHLLRESVCEYLERSNYNSTLEIANLLQQLGFSVAGHNAPFPDIEQMIQRRHQIVHRADKTNISNSNDRDLQPIESKDLQRWAVAVIVFVSSVLPVLAQKMITPDKVERAIEEMLRAQAQPEVPEEKIE